MYFKGEKYIFEMSIERERRDYECRRSNFFPHLKAESIFLRLFKRIEAETRN